MHLHLVRSSRSSIADQDFPFSFHVAYLLYDSLLIFQGRNRMAWSGIVSVVCSLEYALQQ